MFLPDPRHYPRMNPLQPLLRALMAWLTATPAELDSKRSAWHHVLGTALQQHDHQGIAQALADAPAQAARTALWDTLIAHIEAPPLHLFVLPLILVAGSRDRCELPGHIPDMRALRACLAAHGVIAGEDEPNVWVSEQLVDFATLTAISPVSWFHARQGLLDLPVGLPLTLPLPLPGTPIVIEGGEKVELRFLVGAARSTPAQQPIAMVGEQGGGLAQWGLAVTKHLQQQWQRTGLTLFVMPRPITGVLSGPAAARFTCLDVGFQLFASTTLRKIREAVGDPAMVISSHDNHEIHLVIASRLDPSLLGTFVWRLLPDDDVAQIVDTVRTFAHACQMTDITLIEQVLPALGEDGLPNFVLPTQLDATVTTTH